MVCIKILVVAFFIMLTKQYALEQDHKKAILLRHFQEQTVYFDTLLSKVTEHLEAMRILAEADLLQSRAVETLNQSLEFHSLTDVADENRFHLDTPRPPITRGMIGNLTGQGFHLRPQPRLFQRNSYGLGFESHVSVGS